MGSGKVKTIKNFMKEYPADEIQQIVVDEHLTTKQIHNLKKLTELQVIDRERLILNTLVSLTILGLAGLLSLRQWSSLTMGRVGFEPTTPAMSRRYLNQARPPAPKEEIPSPTVSYNIIFQPQVSHLKVFIKP
jgi:GTP-binding GTPase N-terminal